MTFGGFRIGKSLTLLPIKSIFNGSCKVVSPELLAAGWSGDVFFGAKVVIVEEVYQPGNKKFFNDLKSRLANDDYEVLNIKNKGTVVQQNLASMYLFSNHADALHFDKGEDKLLVIEAPTGPITPESGDAKSFYRILGNHLKSPEGAGAVLHFLLQRDVSDFSYSALPVRTDALLKMCLESKSDYQKALHEMIEDNAHPFDLSFFKFEQVRQALLNMGYKFGISGISEVLKAEGYIQVRGQMSGSSRTKSARVWTHQDSELAKAKPVDQFEMINSKGMLV